MFHRVLVANRGEIAARICRTLRDLGVASVAVYADDDRGAPHTRLADKAVALGPGPPSETYLAADKLVAAALENDCDAVHPGYGFLSERADFARKLEAAGVAFIGPPPAALELLGDKAAALRLARELGVPTTPGSDGPVGSLAEAERLLEEIGTPVVVKAVHGGGGMGMVRVDAPDELPAAWSRAREQAGLAFGNEAVLVERWWERARHVEVQVARDRKGRAVHLFERECSIQRRNQKLVEEAPAPDLSVDARAALARDALTLCEAAGVEALATVEFLVTDEGHVFNEVNPRLQVEHTVTEEITGQDLVAWQLALAAGEDLPRSQEALKAHGAAVQARVNVEDPLVGFTPNPGSVVHAHVPDGPALRIDHAIVPGGTVAAQYDSLLAKVIGRGPDRPAALTACRDGLARLRVGGLATTAGFLHHVLGRPEVQAGPVHTTFLDTRIVEDYRALVHGAMAALLTHVDADGHGTVVLDGHEAPWIREGDAYLLAGKLVAPDGEVRSRTEVEAGGRAWEGRVVRDLPRPEEAAGAGAGAVTSPIPGVVVEVLVRPGDKVAVGAPLVVLDAMKMRNRIQAAVAGTVAEVPVGPGRQVAKGDVLVRIEPS